MEELNFSNRLINTFCKMKTLEVKPFIATRDIILVVMEGRCLLPHRNFMSCQQSSRPVSRDSGYWFGYGYFLPKSGYWFGYGHSVGPYGRQCRGALPPIRIRDSILLVGTPIGASCKVQGSGFRVQGSGFRVQGARCKVQDAGFRVQKRLQFDRGSACTRICDAISRVRVEGLRFSISVWACSLEFTMQEMC